MKIFEKIIEKEIRKVIDVSEMQFGFMPGRVTIDAIFIVRQLVRWSMKKLNVDEWLTETIMAMQEFSNGAVRVNNTVDNKFNDKVGVHHRSVLSSFLFIMVLEALSREFRSALL